MPLIWVLFILLILFLIFLDIALLHKKDEVMPLRSSLGWTAFWIFLALVFNVVIYFAYEHHWLGIGLHVGQDLAGRQAAIDFFTGYLIEKSLSIDNLFVIAVIFSFFKIPLKYQHRILFWGIVGALVFRGLMIGVGSILIAKFFWMNYIFGALLIFTAGKMLMDRGEEMDLEQNTIVKFVKRFYPVATDSHTRHFFAKQNGKTAMTPLFLALIVIETSDVFFAIDSIPAIFSITTDSFLVFTSNVFAILGLRSLYFAIASLMESLRYLKTSLVFLLAFVGMKLILAHHFHIPTWVSLTIIGGILLVGIIASLLRKEKDHKKSHHKN